MSDQIAGSAMNTAVHAEKQRNRRRWLPLLPTLIFLIVVTQIPFVVTILMSFTSWNIMYPDETAFGTLENYKNVFADQMIVDAMGNTVFMVVATVVICLILGLVLALLLNRKFKGRGVVRTLLITPFLIMPMASSLIWKHLFYNPQYGLYNGILTWIADLFGMKAVHVDWTGEAPMAAIITTLVWTWTPFMFLILLAGLQAQDPDVLEAADVDGASAFSKFRYLTLPMLRPYIELSIVLGTIYLLNTYDQVFAITQGGPGTSTTNLPYAIYLTAFRGYDYGKAAAAGVIVVLASIVIAFFGLRLVSSLADDTQAPKKGAV